MKFYLGFVFAAAIAIVYSSRCMHNDVSMCSGLNCTDPNMMVGCEHDICTCVMDFGGFDCMDIGDCRDTHCKHDEEAHCVDKRCSCLRMDHHG